MQDNAEKLFTALKDMYNLCRLGQSSAKLGANFSTLFRRRFSSCRVIRDVVCVAARPLLSAAEDAAEDALPK